jgi:hypothetical protein
MWHRSLESLGQVGIDWRHTGSVLSAAYFDELLDVGDFLRHFGGCEVCIFLGGDDIVVVAKIQCSDVEIRFSKCGCGLTAGVACALSSCGAQGYSIFRVRSMMLLDRYSFSAFHVTVNVE